MRASDYILQGRMCVDEGGLCFVTERGVSFRVQGVTYDEAREEIFWYIMMGTDQRKDMGI